MQIETLSTKSAVRALSSPDCTQPVDCKQLYRKLFHGGPDDELDEAAENFLAGRLREALTLEIDLPAEPDELEGWVVARGRRVGSEFQRYLAERNAGAPRRFFPTRAHALHFLRAVAPTKLVDGAWLYGLMAHWRDARFASLIAIYLDELGNGDATYNHVAVYRRLLAEYECHDWDSLPGERFLQGTTQLALGRLGHRYLPEVIGYNFGYEQPPLHLLITSHELAELGINPWYFTLHVTVDNAASGHAIAAARAVAETLPLLSDRRSFWRRVRAGFALSELAPGSLDAMASFDLDAEFVRVLRDKALVGSCMHASRSRIGGRTVNDWLSNPADLPEFVAALQRSGWLVRGADPAASRFWQLLVGADAKMSGVFTRYERQIIRAWIRAGTMNTTAARRRAWPASHRTATPPAHAVTANAAGQDERRLLAMLGSAANEAAAITQLLPLLGPHAHFTPAGLLATRIYRSLHQGEPLQQALAREKQTDQQMERHERH